MASKTAVLSQLTRAELLSLVDLADVEVGDRRVREQLITALASSRRANLPSFLATFPRTRLKEIARKLGVDDGGREKAAIVENLLGGSVRARTDKTGGATADGKARGAPARKRTRALVG